MTMHRISSCSSSLTIDDLEERIMQQRKKIEELSKKLDLCIEKLELLEHRTEQ